MIKKNPVWRFLSSTQLAVILLIVFTISSVLGTLLPQMTPDLTGETHIRWLTLAHDKYGALTDLYRTLGLFNVYRSAWFRLVVVVLVINVAVCTIDRFGGIWRAIRAQPRVKQHDAFYEGMAHRAILSTATEETEETVKTALSRRRYRLLTEKEGETVYFYSDRNRLARLGTIFTHLGLILIVAAIFWRGLSAWREDEVILGPGQVYAPGRGPNFQVRNDGFEVERYPDGRPRDYLSHLAILEEGREIVHKTVRINEPLSHRGLSLYLSSYGPAVLVRGTDGNGEPLALTTNFERVGGEETQNRAVLIFAGSEGGGNEGNVFVPSLDLTLHLSFASPRTVDQQPTLYLEAHYDQSGEAMVGFVRFGQTVELEGASFVFTLEHYTVLMAVHDPSFGPLIVASLLMLVGLVISFYFPHRRIWARVRGDEVSLAGLTDRDAVGFESEFEKLVTLIGGR